MRNSSQSFLTHYVALMDLEYGYTYDFAKSGIPSVEMHRWCYS